MDAPPETNAGCALHRGVGLNNRYLRERQAGIQVVTLEGFKPVSRRFVPNDSVPETEPTKGNFKLGIGVNKIDFESGGTAERPRCALGCRLAVDVSRSSLRAAD